MSRMKSIRVWLAALLWIAVCARGIAEDRQPAADQEKKPAAPPAMKSPYRQLAPGVMQTIDPMRLLKETTSRHDVVEILAADKKFDWARDVPYRRDVWVLGFQFKPVRMIWVDIPQASGKMQRKLIWYLVYSVTNNGKILHPVEDAPLPYDTHEQKLLYEVQTTDRAVRFAPEFLLEGHQRMDDDTGFTKVYADRIIPVALTAIRDREDPKRKFLNSVEMCREIEVGQTVWGIAAWEDIDPRIVRFSIYVSGLTNAYRWKDAEGAFKAGDKPLTGRTMWRKILKLNFWRPADPYFEHEEEIRYGIPGGVDYEWVYR
jgi:hypothetical protein